MVGLNRSKLLIMKKVCLLCIQFALLFACSTHSSTEEKVAIPVAFSELCSNCHGKDLNGGLAQSLLDGIWQYGARNADLFRAIKFGIPHAGMPSWGAVLSDEEIQQLVLFLREVEKSGKISKPSTPTQLETQDYLIQVEVFAEELETPWGLTFIDANLALVTERPGRLRIIESGVLLPDPVAGIPEVWAVGEGGLLDVALDPDFAANGWVYLSHSHRLPKDSVVRSPLGMTRLVRGRIKNHRWTDEEILFEAAPETYLPANNHFGGRITFDQTDHLLFSIGDRAMLEHAQDLNLPNGKVHRLRRDGSIPGDNPFHSNPKILQTIYTYGHRNPQGLTLHEASGTIWETEHGPLGGDELNILRPGNNYGWPSITYGREYDGSAISEITRKEGMEQPVFYWIPSLAASSLTFYQGPLFPKWHDQLLVGGLKSEVLLLMNIEKGRVMYEQAILKNAGRVRDVDIGPDGAIYVVLNQPGKILRLIPQLTG